MLTSFIRSIQVLRASYGYARHAATATIQDGTCRGANSCTSYALGRRCSLTEGTWYRQAFCIISISSSIWQMSGARSECNLLGAAVDPQTAEPRSHRLVSWWHGGHGPWIGPGLLGDAGNRDEDPATPRTSMSIHLGQPN